MLQRLSGQSDNRKIAPAEAIAGRGDFCFRGTGRTVPCRSLHNGIGRDLTAGLLLFPFAERFVHFLLFLLVVLFRVSLHFVDEMVDFIAEILLAWSACVVLFHNRLLLMFTKHDSKMRTIPFLERNLFRSRPVRTDRCSCASRRRSVISCHMLCPVSAWRHPPHRNGFRERGVSRGPVRSYGF